MDRKLFSILNFVSILHCALWLRDLLELILKSKYLYLLAVMVSCLVTFLKNLCFSADKSFVEIGLLLPMLIAFCCIQTNYEMMFSFPNNYKSWLRSACCIRGHHAPNYNYLLHTDVSRQKQRNNEQIISTIYQVVYRV